MTLEIFLSELEDLLQTEASLRPDVLLHEMEEWDSLAIMSCMAFFDKKFGIRTSFSEYKDLTTVAELVGLAKGAII